MRVQSRETLDKADIPCKPNNKTAMSKTEKFLQYILESKSKITFKQYKMSINLFTTYYNETHETNLTSDDFIKMRKQDFLSEDFDQQRREILGISLNGVFEATYIRIPMLSQLHHQS